MNLTTREYVFLCRRTQKMNPAKLTVFTVHVYISKLQQQKIKESSEEALLKIEYGKLILFENNYHLNWLEDRFQTVGNVGTNTIILKTGFF